METAERELPEVLIGEVTRITADFRQKLAAELQAFELVCAATTRSLYAQMRESIHQEISMGLHKDSEARLQDSLAKLREQFTQKIERAGFELELERRRLRDGAGSLEQRDLAVIEELHARELELDAMDMELAAMIDNPEIEISKVMRHNAKQAELKAYIRGLKFQRGEGRPRPEAV